MARHRPAKQEHFQRNSSWYLAKLSASVRAELLPTLRISPQPFFWLQPFPRLLSLLQSPPKLPT